MYQQPRSNIASGFTQAPATASSNCRRQNHNTHLVTNLSVGAIHTANSYLPPPPGCFRPYLMNSTVRSEPKYLFNWCVSVNDVNFEHDETSLIAELSGTLLANDGLTVLFANYYAGRLKLIISHNIVITHTGVHYLIGPISQGFPNNFYRACLEANGIPMTWKYILKQFSDRPAPKHNQITTSTAGNNKIEIISIGLQEFITSYGVLRHFVKIANRRKKEHRKACKPISLLRQLFHEKLVQSMKIVNAQIIEGLKQY